MTPPPALATPEVAPLRPAASGAIVANVTLEGAGRAPVEGRTTVWITGAVDICQYHPPALEIEDAIEYDAAAAVLRNARPVEDDIEIEYRSPLL